MAPRASIAGDGHRADVAAAEIRRLLSAVRRKGVPARVAAGRESSDRVQPASFRRASVRGRADRCARVRCRGRSLSACAGGDWRARATAFTSGAAPMTRGQSISRRVSSSTMASRPHVGTALPDRCGVGRYSAGRCKRTAAAAPGPARRSKRAAGSVRCDLVRGSSMRQSRRQRPPASMRCSTERIAIGPGRPSRTTSSPSRNIGFVRAQEAAAQEVAFAHRCAAPAARSAPAVLASAHRRRRARPAAPRSPDRTAPHAPAWPPVPRGRMVLELERRREQRTHAVLAHDRVERVDEVVAPGRKFIALLFAGADRAPGQRDRAAAAAG